MKFIWLDGKYAYMDMGTGQKIFYELTPIPFLNLPKDLLLK